MKIITDSLLLKKNKHLANLVFILLPSSTELSIPVFKCKLNES